MHSLNPLEVLIYAESTKNLSIQPEVDLNEPVLKIDESIALMPSANHCMTCHTVYSIYFELWNRGCFSIKLMQSIIYLLKKHLLDVPINK